MIFDDLNLKILKVFPVEIWLLIKKFYIRNYLKENLFFPLQGELITNFLQIIIKCT
jgi:hypothetical protein